MTYKTVVSELVVDDLLVELHQKKIKNLHLRVYPPFGHVKVSAPFHMPLNTIKRFILTKRLWINEQQKKIKNKALSVPQTYCSGEMHFVEGRQYRLRVVECNTKPQVNLLTDALELKIRPESRVDQRKAAIELWYRQRLNAAIPPLIKKYEERMGVDVREFRIKRMKTRWGTCNINAHRIWVNLELAKKPLPVLEYIVVHEMAHLIESSHNQRFVRVMNTFLPNWQAIDDVLNQ